ncbi:phBC6A51 family helix-turn-helix protein [Paenibacillus tundrae]|uniref:AcrR family transcriptional regulator n=1 Tax=Paenibacillus tundrae TaxID=528187 RepID=A0ABT9W696_9BACL|nr:phBC6A51 family helix-turn-helix protein [Paenibacillus tundrae]MDQ0168761.1 AcrR family transcriptional regulator [Paenibacillus tundrae]
MLKRIETHHAIAIRYLALPKRGGLTMEQIATEAGVSRRAVYDWLKDPLFDRELKKEIVRQTTARLPEVMESLTDAVLTDHNAAAAKLLLQVNGMLTDKVEVETKVSGDVDIDALRERIKQAKGRGV